MSNRRFGTYSITIYMRLVSFWPDTFTQYPESPSSINLTIPLWFNAFNTLISSFINCSFSAYCLYMNPYLNTLIAIYCDGSLNSLAKYTLEVVPYPDCFIISYLLLNIAYFYFTSIYIFLLIVITCNIVDQCNQYRNLVTSAEYIYCNYSIVVK